MLARPGMRARVVLARPVCKHVQGACKRARLDHDFKRSVALQCVVEKRTKSAYAQLKAIGVDVGHSSPNLWEGEFLKRHVAAGWLQLEGGGVLATAHNMIQLIGQS